MGWRFEGWQLYERGGTFHYYRGARPICGALKNRIPLWRWKEGDEEKCCRRCQAMLEKGRG